jgi:hypothetical protein
MSEKKTAIVMEESQSGRHAVIEARRNEGFSERFVSLYRGQESLRVPVAAPRQTLRLTVGLAETRRIACATLQNAVVAGILLFYSRSVLGAVVRAFVGA